MLAPLPRYSRVAILGAQLNLRAPMPLSSAWFRDDPRLQKCLVSDPHHVLVGDRGAHVRLIQQALAMLDGSSIDPQETSAETYGRSTATAVKEYKKKRQIINRAYQSTPDDIVGKMTIASLDAEMASQEQRRTRLLFAVGIPATAAAKGVVVTEPTNPWNQWAEQFVKADPNGRARVIMQAASPKAAVASLKQAIATANGGLLILSVGHGGLGEARNGDEGMLDLAPNRSFRIAGRNAVLPGDSGGGAEQAHTSAFYNERIPNKTQKSGFIASRFDDDTKSQSPNAKIRLANWAAYDEICAAFRTGNVQGVLLVTCKVGGASGFLKRVAQQWKTPIIAYTKRVAAQVHVQNGSARARLFVQGDPSTDIPWGEYMFPVSWSMTLIRP